MANQLAGVEPFSTKVAFLILAGTRAKQAFAVAAMLLVTFACLAQDQPQLPAPSDSQSSLPAAAPPPKTVTIPAGTRFALVLGNSVASKTMHRGDEIYTQTVASIVVGDRVAIPAGTFVQGKLDKLARNSTRAEMHLQSASVVFPDGFVAGAIAAPLAGLGLGTLIGHAAGRKGTDINGMTYNRGGLKSTAIGGVVGLAAGGVVSFIFLAHSRQFFVDVGSPMQMTLPQPLALAENKGERCCTLCAGTSGDADAGGQGPAAGAYYYKHRHLLYAGGARDTADDHSGDTGNWRYAGHTGHCRPRHSVNSGVAVSVSAAGSAADSTVLWFNVGALGKDNGQDAKC